MDGFSLEMGGGDLLDLGSFGLFGDNTTGISSPSTGNNNMPLSVGTPTGVASLQSTMFAAGDNGNANGNTGDAKNSEESDNEKDSSAEETAPKNSESAYFDQQSSNPQYTTSTNTVVSTTTSTAPESGDSFTKSLQSVNATISPASVQMNMTQSSARPHISTAMGTHQSMAMGISTPMVSAPMMNLSMPHQQQMQAAQYAGVNAYANEMTAIKQQLMMQPDLIPPPPQVIHAGQQYMLMAARMSGAPQPYMQQQQQMMMPGQHMYAGGMTPNVMGVSHSPSAAMEAVRQQQLRQQHIQQQRTQMGNSPPVAWQSEADIPLRRKMIAKIVSLLQQRKPDAPPEWIKKLPDMARRLEDSLYRTAANRNEYGNFGTLKHRLQQLAITMGAKSASRARSGPPAQHGIAMPGSSGMTPTYSSGMQYATSGGGGPGQHQQYIMQQHQMQMQQQQQAQMQQAQMQQAQLQRQNSLQQQQQYQQAQQQYQQAQQQQMLMQQQQTASHDQTSTSSEPPPIPDLQEVDDADFLNFDLSPSMGGALDFDLEKKSNASSDAEDAEDSLDTKPTASPSNVDTGKS